MSARIRVDDTTNPKFVLYNIVFGNDEIPSVNTANVCKRLHELGVKLEKSAVEECLHEWYMAGMLRLRNGNYFVAT